MKYTLKAAWFFGLVSLAVAMAGCLKFGDDVETTSPTTAQVKRCVTEMHLNPAVQMTPLGFRLIGSGIDDSIRFKFKTSVSEVSQIFDPNVVDVTKFTTKVETFVDKHEPKWWDTKGKSLLGGQVQLPNARFMDVWIEKTQDGCVVYIHWSET